MEKFLTFEEFWKRSPGLGRDFLKAKVRSGAIKHIKSGRKYLIPESELEAWPKRAMVEEGLQ